MKKAHRKLSAPPPLKKAAVQLKRPSAPFKPVPVIGFDDIPGYKDAVAVERKNRMLAWFDVSQSVCGFEVMPLTPLRYLRLQLANSPLLRFQVPTAQELAQFLWLMSPEYERRGWLTAWFFSRRCRKSFAPAAKHFWQLRKRWEQVEAMKGVRFEKLCESICRMIEQAYQDASRGSGDGKSYYNEIVSLVGLIARGYGWSEADILRMPMARLFQYARECQERDSLNLAILTKTRYRNPLSNPSDAVTAQFCYEYGRKSVNGKN